MEFNLETIASFVSLFGTACGLFYTLVHEQYPIMMNCLAVITLEGSLLYMKHKFGNMKKSSSQTSLVGMDLSSMVDEEN